MSIGQSSGQLNAVFIISRVPASGNIFWFTFRSLSDASYTDEFQTKNAFSGPQKCSRYLVQLNYSAYCARGTVLDAQ